MPRKLIAMGAALAIGLAAAGFYISTELNCSRAESGYEKWGFVAAMTKAPEAYEKMRQYKAQLAQCRD